MVNLNAQTVELIVDSVVHSGDYGEPGHDLTGYCTYRVFAQFPSVNYRLLGLVAPEIVGNFCDASSDSALYITSSTGFFQHEQGAALATSISCGLAGLNTLEFDSYFALGTDCYNQQGANCDNLLYPDLADPTFCHQWIEDFENTNSLGIYDGGNALWENYFIAVDPSVACVPTDDYSFPNADNQVLIGQFTTDGNFSGNFNLAFIDLSTSVIDTAFNLSVQICKFPFEVVTDVDCVPIPGGNNQVIGIANGSPALVDFEVFNVNDPANSSDDVSVDLAQNTGDFVSAPLPEGLYYVVVTDDVGCRDTSEFVMLESPPVYSLDTTRTRAICSIDTNFMLFEIPDAQNASNPLNYYFIDTQFDALPNNDIALDTLLQQIDDFEIFVDSNLRLIVLIEDSNECISTYGPIEYIVPEPIDMSISLDTGFCSGDLSTIIIAPSPFANITYSLYRRDTIGNAPDVFISETLQPNANVETQIQTEAGAYVLYASNDVGCIDSTEVFGFPLYNFTLTVVASNESLCPDTAIGILVMGCAGGYGTVSLTLNDSSTWNGVPVVCSQIISTMSCGTYEVTATDNAGCSLDTIVSIPCFDSIQMNAVRLQNEQCYLGYAGRLQVNCGSNENPIDLYLNSLPISCDSIVDSLTCGDYVVRAVDIHNCDIYDTVSINCPLDAYNLGEKINFNGTPICTNSLDGDTLFFNNSAGNALLFEIDGTQILPPDTAFPIGCGEHVINVILTNGCQRDTTISIACIPIPEFGPTKLFDVHCFGDSTGLVSIFCNDVDFDSLRFNGVEAQCDELIQNLECGDYLAEGFYADGCLISQTLSFNCPQAMQFIINEDPIECYGDDDGVIEGTVTGGSGNFSAFWTVNGEVNNNLALSGQGSLLINFDSLDGGQYVLHVLDTVITIYGEDSLCLTTDTIEIFEPEQYTFTKTITHVTCFGDATGSVEYVISGGTAPYDVNVADTSGFLQPGPFGLVADQYVVTLTDNNNCGLSDTITILQPDSFQYFLNYERVSCFGLCDGQIEINNVSGNNGEYTYAIDPLAGDCGTCSGSETQFVDLCTDDYVVTLSDSSGCSVEIPVQINTPDQLNLILATTNVTCFGLANGEISMDYTGGTPPVVFASMNLTLPDTLSSLGPDWYYVLISDSSGCTDLDSVIITEPDLLRIDTLAVNAVSCGTLCDGSIVYAPQGGTPPYNFLLAPDSLDGVANGNIFDLCAGEYIIYVSDIQSCVDSLSFAINSPAQLSINSILDQPTCTGMTNGSLQLLPSGGVPPLEIEVLNFDYELFRVDSVSYAINNIGEDSLFFLLTDAVNCIHRDTVAVTPEIITDMVLNFFSSPETCWGEANGTATVAVVNGNLPISFLWDDSNKQTSATAVGLGSNQEFTVTVTDHIGCTLKGSVFVENTDTCLVITNAITPNGDGINDVWTLGGLEFFTNAMVYVHNRWGQLVYSSKGYSEPWDGKFRGRALPIGDYYYSIEFGGDMERITGTVTIKY